METYFKPFCMPQPRKPRKAKPTKRPPPIWDGKKPLKFRWTLYCEGYYYPGETISCYNIEARTFTYKAKEFTDKSFLVKRLD